MASQQLENIMERYGVTTMRQLLRAIRNEWAAETGAVFTLRDAENILDEMTNAEYERIAAYGAEDK